jgi:hypothetical protein
LAVLGIGTELALRQPGPQLLLVGPKFGETLLDIGRDASAQNMALRQSDGPKREGSLDDGNGGKNSQGQRDASSKHVRLGHGRDDCHLPFMNASSRAHPKFKPPSGEPFISRAVEDVIWHATKAKIILQGSFMSIRYHAVAVALLALSISAQGATAQTSVVNQAVTENEVLAAQKAWCNALVDISSTYASQGPVVAKALAEKVIDAAYGYQMGAVLFKPTLTVAPQTFRTTRAGALAYFVGGDAAFPKDTGFALKGWTKCEIVNSAIFIAGTSANTMGNVNITGKDGKVTTVDKTWAFVKDDAGKLRIVVHHSSLPYTGS